jgi:hypothetical protein
MFRSRTSFRFGSDFFPIYLRAKIKTLARKSYCMRLQIRGKGYASVAEPKLEPVKVPLFLAGAGSGSGSNELASDALIENA